METLNRQMDEERKSNGGGHNDNLGAEEHSVEEAIGEDLQQSGGKAAFARSLRAVPRDEESLAGLTSVSTIRTVPMGHKRETYKSAQVLDLNQALEKVSSEEQMKLAQGFKRSLQ